MKTINYRTICEIIDYQSLCLEKRIGKSPNVILIPEDLEIINNPIPERKEFYKSYRNIPIRFHNGKEITVGYFEIPPNDHNYVVMPKNYGRKEAKQNFQEWLRKTNPGLKLSEGEVVIGVDIANPHNLSQSFVVYDELTEYLISKKPPLGVKPKRIAKLERAIEINAAIGRYLETDTPIKREWTIELDELVVELYSTKEANK